MTLPATTPAATYSDNESPDWQPYKFSGKESLTRVGLKLYDFGARMYSPSNMRWMTMDPLCEKYYHISPYVYCFGNPIRFVDPDGRDGWDKVIGCLIGAVTNVVPGTGPLRDSYSPNDPKDYNDALRATDEAAAAIGALSVEGGKAMTGAGLAAAGTGGVMILSVAGSPEGVAVASEGMALAGAGVKAILAGGDLMLNAANNSKDGYERGGTKANVSRDNGKNEKHGDRGRSLSKTERQRSELQ
ncbi:MAG: RHS repeat-associated core domain-containing protein [Bacteroidales bacterium]|nr:RHS repeat-associated core domain-containing protein [Bacteroidales bacterium]